MSKRKHNNNNIEAEKEKNAKSTFFILIAEHARKSYHQRYESSAVIAMWIQLVNDALPFIEVYDHGVLSYQHINIIDKIYDRRVI